MRARALMGRRVTLFRVSDVETHSLVFTQKNTLVRRFRVPNGRALP